MAAEIPENPASEPLISRNQQGGRFQKGQSGNPAGRVPGSRNKATLIREAALAERAVSLLDGLMEKAEAGDMGAARLVLARLLPMAGVAGIELAPIATTAEIAQALGRVAAATAAGDLTPGQANALSRALQIQIQARELMLREQEAAARREAATALARETADYYRRREALDAQDAAEEAAEAASGQAAATAAATTQETPCRSALLPMAEWLQVSGMAAALARQGAAPVSASASAPESRGSRH